MGMSAEAGELMVVPEGRGKAFHDQTVSGVSVLAHTKLITLARRLSSASGEEKYN